MRGGEEEDGGGAVLCDAGSGNLCPNLRTQLKINIIKRVRGPVVEWRISELLIERLVVRFSLVHGSSQANTSSNRQKQTDNHMKY